MILISKKFDVSIAWLLGIEEDTDKQKEDISAALEDYLKGLSEMSERHIPVYDIKDEKGRKSHKLVSILSWIIIGCMLLWNMSLNSRIGEMNVMIRQLSDKLSAQKYTMDTFINDTEIRFSDITGKTSVVAGFSYDYISYDPVKNTAEIFLSALLNNAKRDTKVNFTIDCGKEDVSKAAEYDKFTGRYYSTVSVPVTGKMGVIISADDGGMIRNEILAHLDFDKKVLPYKTADLWVDEEEAMKIGEDGKTVNGIYIFSTDAPAFSTSVFDVRLETVKTEILCYHNGKMIRSVEMSGSTTEEMTARIDLTELFDGIRISEWDSIFFKVRVTNNYGHVYSSGQTVSLYVRDNAAGYFYRAPSDTSSGFVFVDGI
ncbi:MAG: hypothetical protein IKM61_08785 [Eubacteriaceae bacterium]|nr:hypothetical protein [Eubacteriaceae bacterium]